MEAYNLIERFENVIDNYTRMRETFFESQHFVLQIRQELTVLREMKFDEQFVHDLEEHFAIIDYKMCELVKLVESEQNISDDLRRVIESYHPCVYGPPI